MKIKTFIAISIAMLCTCTSCVPATATEIDSVESTESGALYTFTDGTGFYLEFEDMNIYPLTGLVTHIEYDAIPDYDIIFITCTNGNEFSFYAPVEDCWFEGNLAACIMDSKGTRIVYDDEVLEAYYTGTLEQFANIK